MSTFPLSVYFLVLIFKGSAILSLLLFNLNIMCYDVTGTYVSVDGSHIVGSSRLPVPNHARRPFSSGCALSVISTVTGSVTFCVISNVAWIDAFGTKISLSELGSQL